MDIFSCRFFDANRIKDFLKKELDIKLLIFKIIERGDSLGEKNENKPQNIIKG